MEANQTTNDYLLLRNGQLEKANKDIDRLLAQVKELQNTMSENNNFYHGQLVVAAKEVERLTQENKELKLNNRRVS